MAALMACALLRCCGDTGEQDDHAPDPGPPTVRLLREQARSCASSTRGQEEPSCDVPSAQDAGVDVLDADVIMLILARCELQDLTRSARGVCSLWRDLADQAALTAFKERWGLRSIVGKPRHPASLATLGKSAFVRQRQLQSHVDTLSSLAVACGSDVATLKQCNNIFSDWSLATRTCIFIPVEDVQQSNAELHFCPFANRQLVIVHTEPGTQLPEELDSAARLRAEEQTTAKLAQILARSLRVDLQQAAFYLRAAHGDIRKAMQLHGLDVRWERSQRRHPSV